ncbi:MOSC N-terminal beta barrel domain-containing protein, partial [Pseudomonas sp.]|uniref:MOSC N-terminal beta barrel domain-containing protein n=1 Tax=Pseudomonas sp. TaxID=306 RepID=UPI0028AED2A8
MIGIACIEKFSLVRSRWASSDSYEFVKRACQMAHVVSLFRYPIKGFDGEKLDSVSLEYGKGFPGDRAVAITRSGTTAGAAPYQQLTTNPALVHFLPGQSLGAATLHVKQPVPRGDLLTDPELLAE